MSIDCSDQPIVDISDNVSHILSCGHVGKSVLKSWSSWNPLVQKRALMEGIPPMTFGVITHCTDIQGSLSFIKNFIINISGVPCL